ncbi:MAG TPA: sucrase ferredoxin, partial [Trebonia sp.]|nr:sucrase ferredoxin [Trebonia sp.]
GWAAGPSPWLRRGDATAAGDLRGQLAVMAEGTEPSFGTPARGPVYLVCTHGRRDACCGRLGAPLARALDAAYPGQVWESTHVGGHRYAANLVILPHGLYYGPVDAASGAAAIDAYQRGQVAPGRYRGRAGQPRDVQEGRYRAMTAAGDFALGGLGS